MSETESKEFDRRLPIMVGINVGRSPPDRPLSNGIDDGLKNYYEAEKKLPQRKPTKSTEKASPFKQPSRPGSKQP